MRGKVQEGKREIVKMGLNGEEFSRFRREGRKVLKDKAEYKTHDGLRTSENVSVARAVCDPWAEAGKTDWDMRVKSFKH